jgi:glycosyltransferase involved in cell wall biosynthesis
MNIFFIDIVKPPGIYSGMEGSMIHKWELISNLSKDGNEIHTLSHENMQYENIFFHAIPKSKRLTRLTYAVFLFKLLKERDFDLLYIRTDAGTYATFGYLLTNFFKYPVVSEINGITFDEQELVKNELVSKKVEILGNLKVNLRKYKEISMWKRSDSIIAVTSGIKQHLVKFQIDESKINVIENGANTDLFKPIDKSIARDKVSLDQKYKYVCFVGNLAPWQGVEFLIKASPLILKEYTDIRFLIVGDGIMKKEWMQIAEDLGISDKFIFTGSVPYEMTHVYINASDVCVVPKKPLKSGYSPLKLYEYMACGRPIIATRTDGFELLEEMNAGILINPENPVDFANSILTLLDNPELMTNMGSNGRKYIVENHSWDSVARKVLQVCNKVIEKH